MKKSYSTILIIVILVAGVWLIAKLFKSPEPASLSQCEVKEITFYYLDGCEWCNKVKSEGTIDKIEELGIKINKINAAVGPIRHQFTGVPTFVIENKVYEGYRTFDEIKELLKCPSGTSERNQPEQNPSDQNQTNPTQSAQNPSGSASQINFIGEKGEKVSFNEKGEISLIAFLFYDNRAKFYNVDMADGKTVYFFVLKDKKGIYRAAANACQVCFKTYKGFRQEGDEIVCNNCGNRYPIEKIATEKGGCNPGPISPNLEVRNGKVIIKQAEVEQVTNLF